ncbi:helix-turn-helix transcriptional regulator [Altererythrobacter sp. BO-6]|uniref:response regulator transcription factor n=1 Tax=Altererythrobacter sp. BO-6 TaxID=2604537 RepID=UPI0013E1CEC2|nr:LuxR C-terminal-related transcriptional regulator [Altererythrobacter sp. BO-6]QIG54969.1 helix-turn-helix transcriptional regulator [Altererythrobacter sp. BO-6]
MSSKPTLHFVDPSSRARAEFARLCFALGHHTEVYGDVSELTAHCPRDGIIVLNDLGTEQTISVVFDQLSKSNILLPVLAVAQEPSASRIVAAVKAGVLDYLSLPLDPAGLAASIDRIAAEAESYVAARKRMLDARAKIECLSGREREVLDWLTRGSSNKAIARELDISPRTVEIHRANMMAKLGASHAADAVRLKLEARL